MIGNVFRRWISFWRKLEGPELEPRIWHSHYLTAHVASKALPKLCRSLTGKILDVGAGTGYARRFLSVGQTCYYPVDLLGGMERVDPRVSLRCIPPRVFCSGYRLPFPDNCWDGVIMLSVMEHLKRPRLVLHEVNRVLKPGGYVVVSTPFAFPFHGMPDDFRRWTLEGLDVELLEEGFEIVRRETLGDSIASLCVNFWLVVRYDLPRSGRVIAGIVGLVMPLILVAQMILNSVAIIVGPQLRHGAFPLGVAVLGRKPQIGARRSGERLPSGGD